MQHLRSGLCTAALLAVSSLTRGALAADAPGVAPGGAGPGGLAAEAPTAASSDLDEDRPGVLLSELSRREHDERIAGAWVSVGVGAAATGAGLLAEYEFDASYGRAVWILGSLSIVGGLSGLLFPTALERFAAEFGPGSAGYSPAALEVAWRSEAEKARTGRKIVSTVIIGLGVAGVAAGAAVAAGVGDLERDEQAEWATIGLVGGAAFVSGGIVGLLLETPMERHYQMAYPAAAARGASVDFGVVPVRGGASLQLQGAF